MGKRALMLMLKAFRQEKWAEEFLDGCLHCNTLRFYRDWDNKSLRDKNEGVIVLPGANLDLKIGDFKFPKGDMLSLSYRPNLMDYIYVYCMYCWAPPWVDDTRVFVDKETQLGSLRSLGHRYGQYAVGIKNPREFFRRLDRAVHSIDSKALTAKGEPVKYEPMLGLPTTPEQTLQAAFHKDVKYIGEQEFRFAFLLDQKLPAEFRLNIGDIRDIAVSMRTEDIFDSIKVNGQTDF